MDTTGQTVSTNNHEQKKTRAIALVLAWAIVGIPLLFGVTETVLHSMKLFF